MARKWGFVEENDSVLWFLRPVSHNEFSYYIGFIDVSDPTKPIGIPRSEWVEHQAYSINDGHIWTKRGPLNVTNPASPYIEPLSNYDWIRTIEFLSEGYVAYDYTNRAFSEVYELTVFDWSDPLNIIHASILDDFPAAPYSADVSESRLSCFSVGNQLYIWDMSDVYNPALAQFSSTVTYHDMHLREDILYLISRDGLDVMTTSDIAESSVVGSVDFPKPLDLDLTSESFMSRSVTASD